MMQLQQLQQLQTNNPNFSAVLPQPSSRTETEQTEQSRLATQGKNLQQKNYLVEQNVSRAQQLHQIQMMQQHQMQMLLNQQNVAAQQATSHIPPENEPVDLSESE